MRSRLDSRTPVIVGAGQLVRHGAEDIASCEPVALMADALRLAGQDSGTGERLLRRADSVRCVPVIAWRYRSAPALLAELLGASPRDLVQSAAIGGDGPQRLLNDTGRAIAAGEIDVAVLAGAESVGALRAGGAPGWRRQADEVAPPRELDGSREPLNQVELAAEVGLPVRMYALLENAVRAESGEDRDVHLAKIAQLWSRLSTVAAENPFAWIRRSYTAAEIATAHAQNRMVAAPYTKLLTANIQVNMGAALIVCSAQAARDAGVPMDRWVFMLAGGQAHDEWHASERMSLAASPAVRAAGRAALEHAGLEIDDVGQIDLYSCFPSAVQIAARELGLSLDDPRRPLTVTGGLTFAGGPGNNYVMHAVAALVDRLRRDPQAYGLASGVGWYMTKHAIGIYSAVSPARPFASLGPQPRLEPARRALDRHAGAARVETYTVIYTRAGEAEAAIIAALTPDGRRALVQTSDAEALRACEDGDPLGATIILAPEDGRTRVRGLG
jgi:acetyl-CoA C-acetyltransferase